MKIRSLGRWRGLVASLVISGLAGTPAPASAMAAGGGYMQLDEPGPATWLVPSSAPAGEQAYQARHFDLQHLAWEQFKFNGPNVRRVEPNPPIDADGMPMMRRDGRLYYSPSILAYTGMAHLKGWLLTGDQRHLDQALEQADKLRELADVRRDAWFMPFEFDLPQEALDAPWYGSASQGLVLSFFTRMWVKLGDPADLEAATGVFESFLRLGRDPDPWISYVDGRGYIWFEHYPNDRADHAIAAHLYATLALHEFWQATGSESARAVLEGGLTTVRDNMKRFRRPGQVMYYCLYHRTAHANKHEMSVRSLERLAILADDPWFQRMADTFKEDYWPS